MKKETYAFITGWNAGDWYTDRKDHAFRIIDETDRDYVISCGKIAKFNAEKVVIENFQGKLYAVPFEKIGYCSLPTTGIEKGIWKEVKNADLGFVKELVSKDPIGFPGIGIITTMEPITEEMLGDKKFWDELSKSGRDNAFPLLDETDQFKDGDFKNLDDRIKKYNNILPIVPDFVTKKVINFTVEDSLPNKGLKVLVVHLQDGSKFVVGGDRYNPTYLVPYANAFDTEQPKPLSEACSYNHGKQNSNE